MFGADGVLVVGAGGAGGEDDHLTSLIGESLEHHDALPLRRRRRERRDSLLNSLLPILGGVQVVMGGIDATSALAGVIVL
ncbi:hypothetical protein Rwratislav_17069 [Rhodococcus wratislaviensis IFP 2016]|nr:hypothetical protein Rwratislav_17069 [Rhodococcus wratislaviensis IFP 2016]